jgi:hypothetical protein
MSNTEVIKAAEHGENSVLAGTSAGAKTVMKTGERTVIFPRT